MLEKTGKESSEKEKQTVNNADRRCPNDANVPFGEAMRYLITRQVLEDMYRKERKER